MDLNSTYSARSRSIALNAGNASLKRQEILNYFEQTFSLYEDLFSLLKNDDSYYTIADPLRHPLIFYLGHTSVFYINKLLLAHQINDRINPIFESQFSVGVDEMSWDDVNQTHYDWPTVAEMFAYRKQVKSVVTDVIKSLEITLPIQWEDPAWIVLMGIEHERIHLETSSVLIRQLPLNLVSPNSRWSPCRTTHAAPKNSLIAVSGMKIILGKCQQDNFYGWDNEYGHEEIDVKDFKSSRFLVSNEEFNTFVKQGGYQKKEYWTDEGWQWREYVQAQNPRFWRKNSKGDYYLRLLAEEIAMPWSWPVEVNYLEAKAFCNWKSQECQKEIRLATESEWAVLRHSITEHYPAWEKPVGNIDLGYYASSCPVDKFQQGDFFDIIGNVWQWTETHFHSFTGFKVHPIYDDFSTPTFDGQHNVIKGGSWISTGNESMTQSRYAFRRHFYQHAGFRYVEGSAVQQLSNMTYESDRLLSEYLEFHFGPTYFNAVNFPKKIVDIALKAMPNQPEKHKALDLGCSVGRASFELAQHFDEVYGVDFSARFINAAVLLQAQHHLNYEITQEGDLKENRSIDFNSLGFSAEQVRRVQFSQGDACNLKPQFKEFNLIIAANLIDRLYAPETFLLKIHQYLVQGGILLISSPYTWLTEYTEKSKWLGGFIQNGEHKTTLQTLKRLLDPHFTQIGDAQDVDFVIRETQRKFQHSVSEVTVWKRR